MQPIFTKEKRLQEEYVILEPAPPLQKVDDMSLVVSRNLKKSCEVRPLLLYATTILIC